MSKKKRVTKPLSEYTVEELEKQLKTNWAITGIMLFVVSLLLAITGYHSYESGEFQPGFITGFAVLAITAINLGKIKKIKMEIARKNNEAA
jgi:hypothetical protein